MAKWNHRMKRLEQAVPGESPPSSGAAHEARGRLMARTRAHILACLTAIERGEPVPARPEPTAAELADRDTVDAFDTAHGITYDGAAREELWARLDRVAARALPPGVGHSRTKSGTA